MQDSGRPLCKQSYAIKRKTAVRNQAESRYVIQRKTALQDGRRQMRETSKQKQIKQISHRTSKFIRRGSLQIPAKEPKQQAGQETQANQLMNSDLQRWKLAQGLRRSSGRQRSFSHLGQTKEQHCSCILHPLLTLRVHAVHLIESCNAFRVDIAWELYKLGFEFVRC